MFAMQLPLLTRCKGTATEHARDALRQLRLSCSGRHVLLNSDSLTLLIRVVVSFRVSSGIIVVFDVVVNLASINHYRRQNDKRVTNCLTM
jgi:hypothetical protein